MRMLYLLLHPSSHGATELQRLVDVMADSPMRAPRRQAPVNKVGHSLRTQHHYTCCSTSTQAQRVKHPPACF